MLFSQFTRSIVGLTLFLSNVHSITDFGGYKIADTCDKFYWEDQGRVFNTVIRVLETLQTVIRTIVLPDIDAPTSKHGYTALFKTLANKPIVKSMLTRMADGATFIDRCLVAPTPRTIDCVIPVERDFQSQQEKEVT